MHHTTILLSWDELDRRAKMSCHVDGEAVNCVAMSNDIVSSILNSVEVSVSAPLRLLARAVECV